MQATLSPETQPRPYVLTTLRPEHFAGLEALQRICYPTLHPDELMRVPHFQSQHAHFAAGQIVVVADGQVIGQGSGFFTDFDFSAPVHRFAEFCDGLFLGCHRPDGAYYYGADISVHPAYRGRGIGSAIYRARKQLVIAHGKRGIVTGGLLPGYPAHRRRLSIAQYVEDVVAGRLSDPTLSFQLKQGFVVRGLLPGYIDDAASDGVATLLLWEPSPQAG
jgi:GNAT superfamily N-acetyltransferase